MTIIAESTKNYNILAENIARFLHIYFKSELSLLSKCKINCGKSGVYSSGAQELSFFAQANLNGQNMRTKTFHYSNLYTEIFGEYRKKEEKLMERDVRQILDESTKQARADRSTERASQRSAAASHAKRKGSVASRQRSEDRRKAPNEVRASGRGKASRKGKKPRRTHAGAARRKTAHARVERGRYVLTPLGKALYAV